MVPMNSTKMPVAVDFDIIQNRVAVALANRERLIKSWTASSSRPRPPPKTSEELDAEDAELFRVEPPHLGLGAPIPRGFLDGDARRKEMSSNEKLRHLIMGKKGALQAGKSRDAQGKAGSTKRDLKKESSDEEEGRSGLGRPKKLKSNINFLARDTTAKDQPRQEDKEEIKQGRRQAVAQDSKHAVERVAPEGQNAGTDHVTRPNSKQVLCRQKHMIPRVLKEQTMVSKKPLVDYSSSEEEDTARPNLETMKSPPKLQAQPPAQPVQPASKPSSASSSTQSSTEPASESEPSDMEIVIPQGLTPDILPTALNSRPAADNTKREKKKLRKARKRERERQERKAISAGPLNGGTEKLVRAQASLGGHSLKLKDLLRDANGN